MKQKEKQEQLSWTNILQVVKKGITMLEIVAMIIVLLGGSWGDTERCVYAEAYTEMEIFDYRDAKVITKGASIDFTAKIEDNYGDEINLKSEEYTFEWYKMDDNESCFLGNGRSYNIEEISDADFCNEKNSNVQYVCKIYLAGEYLGSYSMSLYDKAKYIRRVEQAVYAEEGDSVTLIPYLADYYGKKIDIYNNELNFVWYDKDGNVVGTDSILVIEEVDATDFYENGGYYKCAVSYENDTVYDGYINLFKKNCEMTYYDYHYFFGTYVGSRVELEPFLYDDYDLSACLDGSEYSFEWYAETTEEEEGYFLCSDRILVIDDIEKDDMWSGNTGGTNFICYIYKNGIKMDARVCYQIYNIEEFIMGQDYNIGVNIGDTVILTPHLKDYRDRDIDLTNVEYEFEWYFVSENISELVGDSLQLAISEVKEEHILQDSYYRCMIYKNGLHYSEVSFRLNKLVSIESAPPIENESSNAEENNNSENNTKETTTVTKPTEVTENETTKNQETTVVATTSAIIENVKISNVQAQQPTTQTTAVTPTPAAQKVKAPAMAKIKKVTVKKKASKVVKLQINKVKGAKGYQVQISKAKKFTKKNILVDKNVKKLKPSIKSKKLKNEKKLFVRVRAYALDAKGKKIYGKWSNVKKVRNK